MAKAGFYEIAQEGDKLLVMFASASEEQPLVVATQDVLKLAFYPPERDEQPMINHRAFEATMLTGAGISPGHIRQAFIKLCEPGTAKLARKNALPDLETCQKKFSAMKEGKMLPFKRLGQ